MMQMQVQQTRTEKEREKRLAQIIKSQGVVDAKRELVRYEPEVAFALLIHLFTKEATATKRLNQVLVIVFCLYFTLVSLWCTKNLHGSGLWPLFTIPIWNFLGWRKNKKQAALLRIESLATLLTDRIKQAERSDLGTLLTLAPLAWENATLQVPLRDQLASLLARTPTDELFHLTLEQRTGLQIATRKAIDEARYNDFFEPLAVAGLLALGSLKDISLKNVAERAVLQHTRGHVCAAAEEYLTQIAK
jgi:hypothetical protein